MRCAVYSTILYPACPAPAPQPWQFDIRSALIGAAVVLLLYGLAYRFRGGIRLGWENVLASLAQLGHYLQASAEDRYRGRVVERARSLVLLAHVAPLDAVFVEPELLSPSPLPQSISQVESVVLGHRVLPLRRILGGHPQLVILGASGTGRTALLAYLALMSARATGNGASRAGDGATLESVQGRLPLYVLLPAMDWDAMAHEGWQKRRDGVEKLVRAAVAAVGGSSILIKALRQHIEAGQAIVLADGWDALLPQQRLRAATWLAELVGALPGNLWLVGAGVRGYAPLTEAGFVPLTLTSWGAGQMEPFARQWMEAHTPADGGPSVALAGLVAELRRAAQVGASPFELTLRAFVYLSDRRVPVKRTALFERALELLLGRGTEPWLLAACRTVLGQIALSLQRDERAIASREEIGAAIDAALPPPEERTARAAARVFRALTGERGLLRPVGPKRYAFVHSLWQAYLVARQLVAATPDSLVERLEDPRWSDVLRFYAELGDMEPLVAAWLRSPDDMFHTRLLVLGPWISGAPEGAAWRDRAMAVLARAFLQPGYPSSARQKLVQVLSATGVPGVTYLFRQALQHPDAEVRLAAVLGLAGLAGESDVPALEAALEDEDPAVREATVRTLASLDVDAATRLLERVLLKKRGETLGPVTAEALAECGAEGEAFLRKLAGLGDVMARRAAVFGLARVGARDVLEEMARGDDQWIVRSAASAALEEMEEQRKISGVAPPPEIEQLPWLISWAAAQGEGVGRGYGARQVLWRALSEGDAPVRLAAAWVLAQIGRPDDIEPLRAALTDPNPAVVRAASEALAEVARRYDLKVAPVDR